MGTKDESLKDDLDMESGFNDAINDLRKSLGQPAKKADLKKSEDGDEDDKPPAKDEDESEPEEGEDEDEEGDEEGMKKSIEDRLREEPEAAAARDVEPFLLQLAKAMDEAMTGIAKRIGKVEKLTKSIGSATLASVELQKATRDFVKSIGDQPMPSGSLRRLEKARFGEGDKATEIDTRDVLAKSRDWVKTGRMDLIEAGNLEGRINKGLLGKVNDRLDQKVSALLKEGK